MEKTKITIKRMFCIIGCAGRTKVELDGVCVGKVANGKNIEFLANKGLHILSIYWGFQKTTIAINVNQDDELFLIAKLNIIKNKLDFYSIDNQLLNTDVNKNSAVDMFNQVGNILLALTVLFICFIIFFVNLKDFESEPDNIGTNVQNVEMTDEEKAELEIERANNFFSKNDYQQAMETCNTVIKTYPSTSVAQNMNSYLQKQFRKFKNITAKELMNEYETNIVNADEKYTDTVVIVSGTVRGIDKTNNDKNLCVLLNSETYFGNVQLNFDTSQTENIATLKPGHKVKAIGRCGGKNGKVLMFFDGNNVMISNCLLID